MILSTGEIKKRLQDYVGENGVVGGAIGRKSKFHQEYLAGLWQEK